MGVEGLSRDPLSDGPSVVAIRGTMAVVLGGWRVISAPGEPQLWVDKIKLG